MESPETPPAENNAEIFERFLVVLKNKFASEGFQFALEPGKNFGYTLQIRGTSGLDQSLQKIFYPILEKNGFDSKLVSSGNDSCTFFLDRKVVDGKVNWKGWFNTPEDIPVSSQTILDSIAGLPEIADRAARREDTLGKISSFLLLAVDSGIITRNEYQDIFSDVKSKGNLR